MKKKIIMTMMLMLLMGSVEGCTSNDKAASDQENNLVAEEEQQTIEDSEVNSETEVEVSTEDMTEAEEALQSPSLKESSSWLVNVAEPGGMHKGEVNDNGLGASNRAKFCITSGQFEGNDFVEEDCLADKGYAHGDICEYDLSWEIPQLNENGEYVYKIKVTTTGYWSAKYVGDGDEFEAFYLCHTPAIADAYTGTVFSESPIIGKGSYENTIDIPIDDKVYTIKYAREGISEFTEQFEELDGGYCAPFKGETIYTVTAPADYLGLMLLFNETGVTEPHSKEDTKTHKFGEEEEEDYNNFTYYLLSDILNDNK